jgi:hypothetical protein
VIAAYPHGVANYAAAWLDLIEISADRRAQIIVREEEIRAFSGI